MPESPIVVNPDRLSALDSSFLDLERDAAHMHVAAVMVLEGQPPAHGELVGAVASRLRLVPRYRQRLAFVPLRQGRPVWVDDPYFNVAFHIRHTALPRPGTEAELARLAGRVFSQTLDRSRPLWELWLVEGLRDGRFALLSKAHHALVDGVSGVDIASVLLDPDPDAPPPAGDGDWLPRPPPSGAQLLADALLERLTAPAEIARAARDALTAPRRVAMRVVEALDGVGALARVGLSPAPPSPFNVRIGPHRRFTWVTCSLDELREIRHALGGTVNDAVLAVVAGALGRYLRRRGPLAQDRVLRAMVPVSTRAGDERGAPGNRISAIWVPLPVGIQSPVARLAAVRRQTDSIKRSGQAVGAQVLARLGGFAPPTILARAARLQAHQRLFNLVVTNVPGPQAPLYLLGRRLQAVHPMVPLAVNQALGIAVMSYCGLMSFGLNADYDALPDLPLLASDLREAIAELVQAARALDDGDARALDDRGTPAPAVAAKRPPAAGRPRSRRTAGARSA
ncbi:MAG TPA: wax ester/triacylglycerol synthase family O-acyltransferase [Solirubrobacteraceae bacterium]|nr:wax ester/triacylglycerol synthase family O-acyltransferase [Solirubrobacteraceae bacterium]